MNSPWLSDAYTLADNVRDLHLDIEGTKFHVILNPDIGSWMALTHEDHVRLKEGRLSSAEWDALYIRSLAKKISNGKMSTSKFPNPAEFPSLYVINTTLQCNLRCKYCFVGSVEPSENMSDAVMRTTAIQALSHPDIKKIIFEFQGGEPLMDFKGMKRFVSIAEETNKEFGKDVTYRIETNGTLITEEIAKFLKEKKFHIGISIDGPKELNDLTRIHEDGSGSYNEIIHGVSILRKNNIEILGVVCTISKYNVKHPKEIVDFFNDSGLKSFKPRPVNIAGREKDSHTAAENKEWLEAYKVIRVESEKLGLTNASASIYEENTYTPFRDYMCLRYPCGAGREVVSINPNGDVYPCDGFKSVKEYKMGNILEESIRDMLEKPKIRELRNRSWKESDKCNACAFHAMCGPCAYSTYGAFGDAHREDPECNARQGIFLYLIKDWINKNMLTSREPPSTT